MPPMNEVQLEIAATAARMVVEEGLNFGPAKHRALKQLGLPGRTALPTNDQVEAQVREYIELFCGDTQPQELRALREHALVWMDRLAEFRPHLGGAVWQGWATRLSDIDLASFCDDPTSAEIPPTINTRPPPTNRATSSTGISSFWPVIGSRTSPENTAPVSV